jgi:hypothetical protein
MLAANFSSMVELGDDVLKPFLQVRHDTCFATQGCRLLCQLADNAC